MLILHWGDNPTFDHFFHGPAVAGLRVLGHIDLSRGVTLPKIDADTLLVIVRYLSPSILPALEQHKLRGGRVAFFMDDDLPRSVFDSSLPASYRALLWSRVGRHLPALERLCDELWVSTPALAQRYAHAHPRIIPPSGYPLGPATEVVSYFYHGSPSTHRDDIEWLRAVVEMTQARNEHSLFMIVGDRQVRRLFGDLPRTLILHPMPWPTYRDMLPALPHHIGLAPLRPTPFNPSRSHTRFFDFTRMGAIGIYSDVEPYRGFVRDGVDGWLLADDPAAWSDKIIELVARPEQRAKMLGEALRRVRGEG